MPSKMEEEILIILMVSHVQLMTPWGGGNHFFSLSGTSTVDFMWNFHPLSNIVNGGPLVHIYFFIAEKFPLKKNFS